MMDGFSGYWSGTGRYQEMLVRSLQKIGEGFNFTVFSNSFQAVPDGVDQRVEKIRSVPSGTYLWAYSLSRRIYREGFDIVHFLFHTPVAAGCRSGLVLTIQDMNPFFKDRGHPHWRRRLYRFLLPRAIEGADKIIAPSFYAAGDIEKVMGRVVNGKISVIPLGGDLDKPVITEESPGSRGPSASGRLLAVNPVNGWKNSDDLMELIARLQDHGCRIGLDIVCRKGKGSTSRFMKTVERMGAGSLVTLHDSVDDEGLLAFYRNALALVSTSMHEGFCLPAAEAMRLGCPVVCFRSGATPETVGKAGVLAEPGDFDRIVGEIVRIASDADYRRGLSERSIIEAGKFTWDKTARDTLTVYRDLLK